MDKLGAVKLNKILWFIDTTYFRMHQKSLSGIDEYVKLPKGPVPPDIQKTLESLKNAGDIKIEDKEFYGHQKRHFEIIKTFNGECFSSEEKKLIGDMVLEICNDHTADSISNLSHTVVWNDAQMGKKIPVYACLAENVEEITPEVLAEAWELVKENYEKWQSL